jgi:NhaA family Na+:H+ antiporter
MNSPVARARDFLRKESTGGLLIVLASVLGLLTANSALAEFYFKTLDTHVKIGSSWWLLDLSVLKIINYLLMSIFFFVVGLEIKRELTSGHFSSVKKALMPFLAAVGGMALPAIIYLAIAGGEATAGWGVPVATDIALAVGLLTMIGPSVATPLRTFLLGVAVIDDVGAILIIAFVYSSGVSITWLVATLFCILVIWALKRFAAGLSLLFIAIAIILWFSLYKAGVHPTLAGVILGLMTPNTLRKSRRTNKDQVTVIDLLEHRLGPVSTFLVVPLFAFANTGVVITSQSINDASTSLIAWGIFFGLVVGKPLGILSASIAAKRLKLAELPEYANVSSILATGSAAGIGFTVAIFIAKLAFDEVQTQDIAVLAVIAASAVSALLSIVLFKINAKR